MELVSEESLAAMAAFCPTAATFIFRRPETF
jgi:hypothetical protein